MRAYEDRYGFFDELERLKTREEKIGRIDKDVAELAYMIREMQAKQTDEPPERIGHSFYDTRRGFDRKRRFMLMGLLAGEHDTPTVTGIDRHRLKWAIRTYLDFYERYEEPIEIRDTDYAARLTVGDVPIHDVVSMKTTVGVPPAQGRKDYHWGHVEAGVVHITKIKANGLAYVVAKVLPDMPPAEIRNLVLNCDGIRMTEDLKASLYTALRNRGQGKRLRPELDELQYWLDSVLRR